VTGPRRAFDPALRREKSRSFSLLAEKTVQVDFWGHVRPVYDNANLSVYSAQRCNARCAFCVEELRPASRGGSLSVQRAVELDDERYFTALAQTLAATRALAPSVSVTGGEPSKDPRLPRILRVLAAHDARKRVVTTNGSGLLDHREGRPVLDWIVDTGVAHLNLSVAHPNPSINARLMGFAESPTREVLRAIVARAREANTRVRLSCALVRGAVDSLDRVREYLAFARDVGADNVVFRQLMLTDPESVERSAVVRFSDGRRVLLEPILDQLDGEGDFTFVDQVVGYYYYVEIYRFQDAVDVVFEVADLARIEAQKGAAPEVVHELVFHPNAKLATTWQPWDGVLGP
jgi:molybdenum cofactor biosynthesis enzyme MoaA